MVGSTGRGNQPPSTRRVIIGSSTQCTQPNIPTVPTWTLIECEITTSGFVIYLLSSEFLVNFLPHIFAAVGSGIGHAAFNSIIPVDVAHASSECCACASIALRQCEPQRPLVDGWTSLWKSDETPTVTTLQQLWAPGHTGRARVHDFALRIVSGKYISVGVTTLRACQHTRKCERSSFWEMAKKMANADAISVWPGHEVSMFCRESSHKKLSRWFQQQETQKTETHQWGGGGYKHSLSLAFSLSFLLTKKAELNFSDSSFRDKTAGKQTGAKDAAAAQ